MRLFIIIGICLSLICASALLGTTSIQSLNEFIFWQLRFPRILTAILVGGTLGITGAAFQALFGNPLATPSTTGTTAGAALGALAGMILLPVNWSMNGYAVVLTSFIGALCISLPAAFLARFAQIRLEDILLSGIALTLAAGAISTGLQFQADMATTYRAVQWSLGSLAQVGYNATWGVLPFCMVSIIGLLTQIRALEALISGEEQAYAQGVPIHETRMAVLIFGSIGVAASVAWCGPIAFVGLVVPHIIRLSMGNVRRVLLPMSGIVGSTFLVFCDGIARSVFSGRELPVGVLTASIGAPILIFLIIRRQR